MSIQTQINRINTEVTSQASLLDQALEAIAGKAAGGGGGAAPDTCTMTITSNGLLSVMALVYKDGAVQSLYDSAGDAGRSAMSSPYTIQNVVCGTHISLFTDIPGTNYGNTSIPVSGGATLVELVDRVLTSSTGTTERQQTIILAPETAGASGTVTINYVKGK